MANNHDNEKKYQKKNVSREKLKVYIQKYLDKGYHKQYLEKFLLQKGYPKDLIISTLDEFKDTKKEELKKIPLSIYIIGVLIVITIATIFLLPSSEEAVKDKALKDCGSDKDCFLREAQLCNNAIVREDLQGTNILYTSSNDCILTKKMEQLAETEPEEVVALFEGESMSCSYEKGSLDPAWVEDLFGGIESCEGNLKEDIYELRIAQLTLEEI